MASLKTIAENLGRAQAELLRAADAVPAEHWKARPADGRWSAGELIGHLSEIERAIEETRGRDLSEYNMPHPFLGNLNAYDWLQFIASHEIRHTKQMKEIADALPKSVTSL